MRNYKLILLGIIFIPVLYSCKKELKVNADWKDVTVVYGLLDQIDTIHYIKITKAFLGSGDAMEFAKIPDSSNYPDKLDVQVEEWNGSTLLNTWTCDTVTIHNKEAGDSIFYFPDQLVYYFRGDLSSENQYKLNITNKQTGKIVSSQTMMIYPFTIEKPNSFLPVNYVPGLKVELKWYSAKNGKRYQIALRFHYLESLKSDTSQKSFNAIDWVIFSNIQSLNNQGGELLDYYFPADGFYSFLGSHIPVNPDVNRAARSVDYIFSVASDDLNTYMEVTEPSYGIIQERPAFSNITNGIGLFSSRTVVLIDSLRLRQETLDQLRVNQYTKDLGF